MIELLVAFKKIKYWDNKKYSFVSFLLICIFMKEGKYKDESSINGRR